MCFHFSLKCSFLNVLGFVILDPVVYILFFEAKTRRRQMTVKLLNGRFTLFLEVANVSKVIRKRCTGRACTLRYHILGTMGPRGVGGQALLRASAVMSFWQSLEGVRCCRHSLTPLLPLTQRYLVALCHFQRVMEGFMGHLLWYAVNNQKGIFPS